MHAPAPRLDPELFSTLARHTRLVVTLLLLLAAPAAWGQQIQFLEHDTRSGSDSALVRGDSNIFVLGYFTGTDALRAGIFKTFDIPLDGSSITEVDSLVIEVARGFSLVRMNANTYAVAYTAFATSVLKTFEVSNTGVITELQSLTHEPTTVIQNSLVQVDADTYLLAFERAGNLGGFLKTFDIATDGSSITEVEEMALDPGGAKGNALVELDAGTFAVAYRKRDETGAIKTFTVPTDGSTITEVQTLEYGPATGFYNSMIHVSGNTYALVYLGTDSEGIFKTFSIAADGSSISEVQTLEFANLANFPSLARVDSDTLALAYREAVNDIGALETFTISAGGNSIVRAQSIGHDSSNPGQNSLTQVDADTYALAYTGPDGDGFIKTFMIDSTGGLPVTLLQFGVD